MAEPSIRFVDVLPNPASGHGNAATVAAEAVAILRNAGMRVRVRTGADPAETVDFARSAAGVVDALVVVGGDGMAQLAADALAGSDTALGVIPAGTGNDVARQLGVDRKRTAAAANAVVAGRTRRIDLAEAFGRSVVTVIASGFDSAVNERANRMRWPRGQMRYNMAVIAELMEFEPIRFTVELDDEVRELSAMLVAVGNGASFGGGLRICEGASDDDGLLDVAIVHPVGKAELVRAYPRLFTGSLPEHPAYERHRVRRVSIAAPDVVAYGDGERLGPLPMTVRVRPRGLRVIVPPGR